MNTKKILLLFIVAVALVISYSNCGQETVAPNALSESPADGVETESGLIMADLCNSVALCFSNQGATLNNCVQETSSMDGLGEKIGLPSGEYEPFSAVMQAEASGAIIPNSVASKQCQTDINSLTCSSPGMAAAYNPNLSNPYTNIGSAFPSSPGSCPSVF